MYTAEKKLSPRSSEAGVTIIEMLIAIAVLTIGLVALAQLFVVATMNNAFAVNVSGGVTDAQRFIEEWKTTVKNSTHVDGAGKLDKINDPAITSVMWDEGTGRNTAFHNIDATLFDHPNYPYKQYVWVYNKTTTAIGSPSPSNPPGVASGSLHAPSATSRLIYVRLVPKTTDPRFNQVITLVGVINES